MGILDEWNGISISV